MERRNFMQNTMLAGASLMTGTGLKNRNGREDTAFTDKPFNLLYAIHDGMFRENAGSSFPNQIQWAYDRGFRAIEDNPMMGRDKAEQQKIGDLLAKLDMQMGIFTIDAGDNWKTSFTTGRKEYVDRYISKCREAIEVAKRCHAKYMTVNLGLFDRELPIGIQTGHVIDMLRRCTELFEPTDLVMVIESLSDNPDLFLRYSDQAYALCRALNSPSCKILFDMYHMQRNEGGIMDHMDWAWDEIGYFQIGNNPGRKEPGTGEMDYKKIFQHIYEKGYKGVLGMEHGTAGSGKEGELALIRAYREADDFLN